MLSRRWTLLLLAAAVSGCTCSDGTRPNPDGGVPELVNLSAILVTPQKSTLTVQGQTPASATLTATGTFSDGRTEDISSKVAWGVADPAFGTFTGNVFTTGVVRGGTVQVTAQNGALKGAAEVTVILKQVATDPSSTNLPSNVASQFGGTVSASRAPDLVYPNDGVLVPPNLGKLEFHFLPGSGNDLFELAFTNDITDVRVYLSCSTPHNGGCIYTPDVTVWSWIAQTNRGRTLQAKLRGTSAGASTLGESASLTLAFSQDDINGGFYYWTTSGGTAIMRYDFGGTGQTAAERFLGSEATGGTCIGCHALSRDGTKLVTEAGGQNNGGVLLLDVGTKQPLTPFTNNSKTSTFESWNPDGSVFVGVYADNGSTDYRLKLFNGQNGAYASSIDGTGTATNPASHPDWSSDGTRIAYTRMGIAGTNQRHFKGSVWMVSQDNAGTFGNPQQLVGETGGKNRYYPAFSPDGSFLVFNESTCPSGEQHTDCNADSDPSAQLFAVLAQTGKTAVPLTKANGPGKRDSGATQLTNSFPKWSPFIFQRTGELGTQLMWLTFSSTRNYGLRTPPAGGSENPKGTLLWMVAVDPRKVDEGVDPSYPAFALPFQDLATSNHIAQWTTVVIPTVN
jgi:hypothetical protein